MFFYQAREMMRVRGISAFKYMLPIAVTLVAALACAEPVSPEQPPEKPVPDKVSLEKGWKEAKAESQDDKHSQWLSRCYIFVAASNAYPRMRSERYIKTYYDGISKLIAPGYDDVTTVSDMRDKGLVWAPQLGVGYAINNHVAASMYGGYLEGKVRTEANDRSIILLDYHSDFEIQRAALYGGDSVDVFPLGMPERKKRKGLIDRLKAARPYVGAGITWTHAAYDAKAKLGIKPFENISVEPSEEWTVPNISASIGVDVPLTERSSFAAHYSHNRFLRLRDDFEGPSFTFAWKHFLK